MPRRSNRADSDISPSPRRTSARIAAVQAASPAKSPAKTPKPKRQTGDDKKSLSEDTESQQSQVKSELTVEDLNGAETGSSTKGHESTEEHELPQKKAKTEDLLVESTTALHTQGDAEPTDSDVKQAKNDDRSSEFELIDKDSVPPHDSAEVSAAISAQGEDGKLLVNYVQIDKKDIPSVASLDVKAAESSEESSTHHSELTLYRGTVKEQFKMTEERTDQLVEDPSQNPLTKHSDVKETASITPTEHSVESKHITNSELLVGSVNGEARPQENSGCGVQPKMTPESELQSLSPSAPAAGDNPANHASSEPVAP